MFMLYALSSQLGTVVCGGPLVKLRELHEISAVKFLTDNKCMKKGNYSMAQVILNKMTPEEVNMDQLLEVDICENHQKILTNQHKTLRQKTCSVENCGKKGELDKLRVTFEMSLSAYQRLGVHIQVGSTVCSAHRKIINSWPEHQNPIIGTITTTQLANSFVPEVSLTTYNTTTTPDTSSLLPCSNNQHTSNQKRKSFYEALEKLPKIAKSYSESSSQNNSQPLISQGSTYSISSEAEEDNRLVQFNQLVSCLTKLDPVVGSAISAPLDLDVQERTLQR